jgi:hypothetical protein
VPSGKLVAGNDFRKYFPVIGSYDINSIDGQARTTHKYIEAGLAHGFVGDNCPGIFCISDSSFVIGTTDIKGRHPVKRSRIVGGITTDLWWYSIADYDEWIRRTGKRPEDERDINIVMCRPGLYHFKQMYHLSSHNYKLAEIFTTIKRCGEPVEVRDYKGEFEHKNITAGQLLHYLFRARESFYGTLENPNFYRTADQILCVLGNGYDWHPNGWLSADPDVDENEPEIEIPVFDKPYHWYGLEDSTIFQMVNEQTANESFACLAFNVLQNIIKYGPQIKEAKELFRLMCGKYLVPEFCQGLKNELY